MTRIAMLPTFAGWRAVVPTAEGIVALDSADRVPTGQAAYGSDAAAPDASACSAERDGAVRFALAKLTAGKGSGLDASAGAGFGNAPDIRRAGGEGGLSLAPKKSSADSDATEATASKPGGRRKTYKGMRAIYQSMTPAKFVGAAVARLEGLDALVPQRLDIIGEVASAEGLRYPTCPDLMDYLERVESDVARRGQPGQELHPTATIYDQEMVVRAEVRAMLSLLKERGHLELAKRLEVRHLQYMIIRDFERFHEKKHNISFDELYEKLTA